jgi:serine/threonine protein kinase
MEHMEGGTLTEATKGHNFTELQIAYVARELLSALVLLHHQPTNHRQPRVSCVCRVRVRVR